MSGWGIADEGRACYRPPPVRFLGSTCALLALLACQASASEPTPAMPAPGTVEPIVARDGAGTVLATVSSARPCRVQVAGVTASIPALPLLVDMGGARWTGETTPNGVVVSKDAQLAARILDAQGALAVFAPTGAAWLRVDAQGAVHGPGGEPLRQIRDDGAALHAGDATVTGTRDRLLAAALTAPELPAEVRALVVCNRLLSNEATP